MSNKKYTKIKIIILILIVFAGSVFYLKSKSSKKTSQIKSNTISASTTIENSSNKTSQIKRNTISTPTTTENASDKTSIKNTSFDVNTKANLNYASKINRNINTNNFHSAKIFSSKNSGNSNQYFASEQFNDWLINVSFSPTDVPDYSFLSEGGWQVYDEPNNAYIYNAPNTEADGHSITKVQYYLYKSKNPLFEMSSPYNTGSHGDFLQRFYFYRMSGLGDGVVSLDNMLFAVDTYSKLVFIFAVPSEYKNIFGHQVPTVWQPVDTYLNDGKYMFYQYEPIGIVNENGEIQLSDLYIERISEGNYAPEISTNLNANIE